MSKIVLYGMDISPPVRSCKILLRALDLPYEYKIVQLFEREQNKPEFIARNPLQTVPILEVDGHFIGDSQAICAYLVDKYAKTDTLYPKDLIARAKVNQCMFFNASIIFMSLRHISIPIFTGASTVVTKEKTDNLLYAYELLETLLADNDYMAGANLTIADLACAPIVLCEHGLFEIDAARFPKIKAWLARISQTSP